MILKTLNIFAEGFLRKYFFLEFLLSKDLQICILPCRGVHKPHKLKPNKYLVQYREALQQRRQEAVATAAIEALTKDSILHRKDVKTLVKAHKFQAKEKDKK